MTDRSDFRRGGVARLASGPMGLMLAVLLGLGAGPAPSSQPQPQPATKKSPPTFTRDVAPIIQQKCQNCHRKHQVGPFPLETYEQVRKRASDIAAVVEDRLMPPWKPEPGVGPKLKHDQSLTPAEIALLQAWSAAGAPRGELKDLPAAPSFAEGWKLGPPDLVLNPGEDYKVTAAGPDVYRCFVIPTNLARDVYISAIDFQPGNRRVVHHINAFIDLSGAARERDKAEEGPGYISFSGPGIDLFEELSFWATGHEPYFLPAGIAQRLPRQCDVILQIHYHPIGKPESDRTRVGIYFARTPVKQVLHWNAASNTEFKIAAGARNVEVKASWYVPVDVDALAVSPHMHGLGQDIRMVVTSARGVTQDLIHIPDWDPSWQSTYFFQKPIPLSAGSTLKVIAHYDNTAHPRNPNRPPKPVGYGFTASDEMCEGFIAVVKKGQDLTQPRAVDDLGDIFARQRLRQMQKKLSRENH